MAGPLSGRLRKTFWPRVEAAESGCWLWTGRPEWNGYVRIQMRGRRYRVHRLLYEWLIGPIPEGLEPDHTCRVRHCVNPTHLEPVTHVENIRRSANQVALNIAKTHCHRGHPFDEANTYCPPGSRRRQCRECLRAADRRRKVRDRARRAA